MAGQVCLRGLRAGPVGVTRLIDALPVRQVSMVGGRRSHCSWYKSALTSRSASSRLIREISLASDKTTVHLKDFASGPDGFLPFVRSVLAGLADYQF